MDPLVHRIRASYDGLPLGERKLAEVILEMGGDLAAYSATELAARAGTSKATAARLVRRLGYADFHDMRHQARASHRNGSPLAELTTTPGPGETLAQHLSHDVASLTRTIETIPAEHVHKAVTLLAKAPRLTVIGFRNSYPLAFYARDLLVQIRPQVRLLPLPGQTISEEFSQLGPDEAVLAVGFRRRTPALARILRVARQSGAPVVLIGDTSMGDIAGSATVVFRCVSRGSRLFDSYVAPMSLLNYLCSGIALALGAGAQERLRRIETLHDTLGDLEA
jgi:DNA-binding MurR/RpiR family transcriptional regulator